MYILYLSNMLSINIIIKYFFNGIDIFIHFIFRSTMKESTNSILSMFFI